MINLIIILTIAIILFFTRKLWGNYLAGILSKNKKQQQNDVDFVIFSPAGIKRVFIIAIEIEEKGDGTVKMTLAKQKGGEV